MKSNVSSANSNVSSANSSLLEINPENSSFSSSLFSFTSFLAFTLFLTSLFLHRRQCQVTLRHLTLN